MEGERERRGVFNRAVEAWYAEHGNVELTAENGRINLVVLHQAIKNPNGDGGLQKYKNSSKCVTRCVRKFRSIISPEKTHRGLIKKVVGAASSDSKVNSDIYNAINNPINNPINDPINNPIEARRLKALRHQTHIDMILNNPVLAVGFFDEDALDRLADSIFTTVQLDIFGGLTMQQAMIIRNFAVYIGMMMSSLDLLTLNQ